MENKKMTQKQIIFFIEMFQLRLNTGKLAKQFNFEYKCLSNYETNIIKNKLTIDFIKSLYNFFDTKIRNNDIYIELFKDFISDISTDNKLINTNKELKREFQQFQELINK